MKYSVIIPIFKVEKFLNRCIESVVNQSYTDFEVILVDDESPDLCPKICDDWAKKDSRIKVIHQKNAGVSSARNQGIKNAKGEYVLFLDGDDYLDPYLLENCNQYKNDFNVLNFQYKTQYENGDIINNSEGEIGQKSFLSEKEKSDWLITKLTTHKFNVVCWRSCYKLSFLCENDLYFNENYAIAEDILFNLRLLLYADNVIEANFFGYVHRIHGNSFCANARGTIQVNTLNEMSFTLYTEIQQKKLKYFEKDFPYIHHYLINVSQMFLRINNYSDVKFYATNHLMIEKKDFYKQFMKCALRIKRKEKYNEMRPYLYELFSYRELLKQYSIRGNNFFLKLGYVKIKFALIFLRIKSKIIRRLKGLFKRRGN